MAAAIETGEGVVAKSEDDAIKLEGWNSYLKFGKDYDSVRPAAGQKVRVHYRPWENPTTKKTYYYLNEIEVLGPPPETAPAGPPGPGPAPVTYQEAHDAAEARLQQSGSGAVPNEAAQEPTGGTFQEYVEQEAAKPGDYAFRDLSIQRQNRLNVAKDCLIANLEATAPEEKHKRMITPWDIAEFERLLVEGAAAEGGSPPPPEDLPGGP